MQCNDFQDRLNELLDERRAASDDVELSRHARECPACAQAFEIGLCLVNLWPGDASADQQEQPEDLAISHLAIDATSTDQEFGVQRPATTPTVGRWIGLMMVAASVAIVVAMRPNASLPIAKQTVVVADSVQPGESTVTKIQTQVSDQETISGLAQASQPNTLPQSATSAFVHQPLISIGILSAHEWEYEIEEVHIPFGAKLQIEPRWMELVSDGMAPVQSSVTKTIDAIKRSLSS